MSDEDSIKTRILSDPHVHNVLMTVAEKAGEAGAKKGVKDSFFLLGVDIEDTDDVDLFRNSMRQMRLQNEDSREKKREIYKGVVTFAAAIFISVVTSLGSIYVRLGGISPH